MFSSQRMEGGSAGSMWCPGRAGSWVTRAARGRASVAERSRRVVRQPRSAARFRYDDAAFSSDIVGEAMGTLEALSCSYMALW